MDMYALGPTPEQLEALKTSGWSALWSSVLLTFVLTFYLGAFAGIAALLPKSVKPTVFRWQVKYLEWSFEKGKKFLEAVIITVALFTSAGAVFRIGIFPIWWWMPLYVVAAFPLLLSAPILISLGITGGEAGRNKRFGSTTCGWNSAFHLGATVVWIGVSAIIAHAVSLWFGLDAYDLRVFSIFYTLVIAPEVVRLARTFFRK